MRYSILITAALAAFGKALPQSAVDPTSIDPNSIDPTSIDPNSIDPTSIDPNSIDPTSIDSNSIDPTSIDPNSIDLSSIDPNSVDPNSIDPSASGLEPRRIVPVTDTICTHDNFDLDDAAKAKYKLLAWGSVGNQVPGKGYHAEWYGTATWYLCNCKIHWRDGIPKPELDEVEQLIKAKCGTGAGGYVWSKGWEKGYFLRASDQVNDKTGKQLCPKGCVMGKF
jgi:hypothetical protein